MKYRSQLVSIVIVNYNGEKILKDCLKSLARVTYQKLEVIVVDNSSHDNSLFVINDFKKDFPRIILKIIKNKRNVGFAEGNNIALPHATGEFVLLLNNDTKVTPSFLHVLVHEINLNKLTGIVQPKIFFTDTGKLQSGGALFTNIGFLYYFGFGKNPNANEYNNQAQIFSANGACMLIRRSVIDEVGLFDDDFFAYYEETDFCQRVLMAGYSIFYIPDAYIFHKGGQTAKKRKESFIFFHSFKNRIASVIKNFEFFYAIKFLTYYMLIYFLLICYYFVKLRIDLSLAIIRAIAWNVFHVYDTIQKRKFIQKNNRKIRDREYLPRLSIQMPLRYYVRLLTNPGEEELT